MEFWPVYQILLGILYIIFRFWLVEIKLKESLEFRKRYLSRFNCYFFGISAITNFKSNIMIFLYLCTYPTLIISLIIWDIPHSLKYFKNRDEKKGWGWNIVEILTMHVPIISLSLYWSITRHHLVYDISLIGDLLIAILIEYTLFFSFDPRNPFGKKKDAPFGWLVIISIVASGFSFYTILN